MVNLMKEDILWEKWVTWRIHWLEDCQVNDDWQGVDCLSMIWSEMKNTLPMQRSIYLMITVIQYGLKIGNIGI